MIDNEKVRYCECGCGAIINSFDNQGRQRRYLHGHYNKGRQVLDETRKKISEAKKGKMIGELNPMFGKKRPDLAERNRQSKGEKHSEETKKKISESGKGRKHTEETKKKMSINNAMHRPEIVSKLSGENSNLWQGGKSYAGYTPEFNNNLKEQIRKRDNYRCQECFKHQDELYGKTGKKYKLHIHHIDFDKKNSDQSNLISLCISCHMKTNYNREHWTDYYKGKIEQMEI